MQAVILYLRTEFFCLSAGGSFKCSKTQSFEHRVNDVKFHL